MEKSVVVLGAGMVGLNTAVRLLGERPSLQVTLVADSFGHDTTSHGAAGILRPSLDRFPDVSTETLCRWTEDSWHHYDGIAKSEEEGVAGVYPFTGYELYSEDDRNIRIKEKEPSLIKKLSPSSVRPLTEAEWDMIGFRRPCGWCYTALLVDPKYHMKWLMNRFLKAGGIVNKKRVHSFEELAEYDVVINCTGLRSRDLDPDPSMIPERGQVIKVHAPWVKHFIFMDNDTYIIPCTDHVVVGGTRQPGDGDLAYRPHETIRFMDRACQIMPSLRKAKVLGTWVGLRPTRKSPKIEIEIKKYSGRTVKVVHHYGHAAYGIALSWGTAVDAVALALTVLENQAKL